MHKTIAEKLTKSLGKRQRRTNFVKVLRTQLWLESIFNDYDLNPSKLDLLISENSLESSNIVRKWLNGKHHATDKKVSKICTILPGSDHIYRSPIFSLLEPKPISNKALLKLADPFITKSDFDFWDFPNDKFTTNPYLPPNFALLQDTYTLSQRGDEYGFFALLYLLRKAENDKENMLHLELMQLVYNAFPALCRNPYFKKKWHELLKVVETLQNRVITTSILIKPDTDVIKKQIYAKEHITLRHCQQRDRHNRFTASADAFKLGRVVFD